jgi:hypothetical protein
MTMSTLSIRHPANVATNAVRRAFAASPTFAGIEIVNIETESRERVGVVTLDLADGSTVTLDVRHSTSREVDS